jgi:hypothetical protein
MFTVVSEDVIHFFAKSRTRPRHDFRTGKGWRRMRRCENAFPVRELFQRHFLDGAAFQPVGKTGVVHDASVTHVNAVMPVASSVSDHVGSGLKWRAHLNAEGTFYTRRSMTAEGNRPISISTQFVSFVSPRTRRPQPPWLADRMAGLEAKLTIT